MKTLIDFIYTVLIGAAVAVFVGLGIWTFYQGPKAPDFPTYSYVDQPTQQQNEEQQQKSDKYNRDYEAFTKANKPYSNKVSGIALGAAAVFYVGGLWLYKRKDVIGEGLALGSVFTAIYAAVRGGIGNSRVLVFICVTTLLLMLLGLVLYRSGWRFNSSWRRLKSAK